MSEKNISKNTSEKGSKVGILSSLIAVIVDQLVVVAISTALMFLVNFIMQFAGYYISGKVEVLLGTVIVINILYTAITESSKLNGTLGKVVTSLRISR